MAVSSRPHQPALISLIFQSTSRIQHACHPKAPTRRGPKWPLVSHKLSRVCEEFPERANGWSMLLSRRTKAGLASAALVGVLGAATLVVGGGMNAAEEAELSSAEIVALRFPEDLEDAALSAAPDAAADRDVEQQALSILAFNPDPLGVPGPQTWASRQIPERASARADPAAASAAEDPTGSIAAAPAGRPAPAPRAKHQPATLVNNTPIASIQ